MKNFEEDDLEMVIRPTIEAMENKIREMVYAEVNSLGLSDYLKPEIYVSRDDELSSGKIPGWIYLLNIGAVTIRINFGLEDFTGEFVYFELLIDTPDHQLQIQHHNSNIFNLYSIGFFKPIVKIWLDVNSGEFEELLTELNNVNGTSIWSVKHIITSGHPKLYLPIYLDGRLIIDLPEDDKSD